MIESRYNPDIFYKSDHSVAFIFTYDSNGCADRLGLVAKKEELLRAFIYPLSYSL